MIAKTTIAAIRWLLFFPLSLTATITTVLLSPLLALCYTVKDGREYLIKPLYWFQTFDAPVDEWWIGGYYKSAFDWSAKLTDADFHAWAWWRYVARVMWLVRNPGYGFGYFLLGFDYGVEVFRRSAGVWDSGSNNYEFTIVNSPNNSILNRYAFQYQAQWHWSASRFLRVRIGWKLGVGQRAVFADHFNPFRPA
jgi:hypothetical protein